MFSDNVIGPKSELELYGQFLATYTKSLMHVNSDSALAPYPNYTFGSIHDFYPTDKAQYNDLQALNLNRSAKSIPFMQLAECLHGVGSFKQVSFECMSAPGRSPNNYRRACSPSRWPWLRRGIRKWCTLWAERLGKRHVQSGYMRALRLFSTLGKSRAGAVRKVSLPSVRSKHILNPCLIIRGVGRRPCTHIAHGRSFRWRTVKERVVVRP